MYDVKRLKEDYNLTAQFVGLLLLQIAFDEIKSGYRDDQPRGFNGRWIIGGGNYAVSQRHTTGNNQIDAVAEKITNILDLVLTNIGPGNGAWYGTFVHSTAANILREMNIPGVGEEGVEQSFSFGDLVRYGWTDSVRTDVILRNDQTGEILAVWDIKTSKERLRPKRINEIRRHLNIGDDIPIIEIHINLGVSVK